MLFFIRQRSQQQRQIQMARRQIRQRSISSQLQADIVNRNAVFVDRNNVSIDNQEAAIVERMEDLEDPQSVRGRKLKTARDRQKRRLQFFVVWTFLLVCVVITLSFTTTDGNCNQNDSCHCGTSVRVWLGVQTAFYFLVTIAQYKEYSLVTRQYASRRLHKKRSKIIVLTTLFCILVVMTAGAVVYFINLLDKTCSLSSTKYRTLLEVQRIIQLTQMLPLTILLVDLWVFIKLAYNRCMSRRQQLAYESSDEIDDRVADAAWT